MINSVTPDMNRSQRRMALKNDLCYHTISISTALLSALEGVGRREAGDMLRNQRDSFNANFEKLATPSDSMPGRELNVRLARLGVWRVPLMRMTP